MPTGDMLMSTIATLPGYDIVDYLGLVAAEACLAPEELKDLKSFIRQVEGGRHPGFEHVTRRARYEGLASLEAQARELGANAVVGLDFDYAYMTDLGLLMIAISGTAVTVTRHAGRRSQRGSR